MSLVNQMLSELQKNQPSVPEMSGLISPTEQPTKSKSFWLVILLFVTILLGVYLQFFSLHSIETVKTVKKPILGEEIVKNEKSNTKIFQDKIRETNSIKQATETRDIDLQSPGHLNNKSQELTTIDEHRTLEKKLVEKNESTEDKKPQIKQVNTKNKTLTSNKGEVKKISRISLAEKDLARLVKHWQLANPKTSMDQLLSLLDRYSDLPGIWLDSLSFIKSKNKNNYENLLNLSVKTFPTINSFPILSAQHYFHAGQYLKATQQLNTINEAQKDEKVYRLAGLILQKLGKHQQAIDNYKKVLLIKPEQGEINMAIGISFDALNQQQQAVSHFAAALRDKRLNPIQKQFLKQRLIAYQG